MKEDHDFAERTRKTARERVAEWRRNDPVKAMLSRVRMRAKIKGLAFALRPQDITIPSTCPVLGIPLRVAKAVADDNSPELDRIDNKRGYVSGNVIVVSRKVNRIKNDATLEELLKVASFYQSLLGRQKL